jgi:O-antigen/teichoic acid export membrane protein
MAYFNWGITLLLAIGAVALLVAWVIHEWRSDRATAIETFAVMIIFLGSAFAADHYLGEEYRWLAFGPLLIWWLMVRPRRPPEGE